MAIDIKKLQGSINDTIEFWKNVAVESKQEIDEIATEDMGNKQKEKYEEFNSHLPLNRAVEAITTMFSKRLVKKAKGCKDIDQLKTRLKLECHNTRSDTFNNQDHKNRTINQRKKFVESVLDKMEE